MGGGAAGAWAQVSRSAAVTTLAVVATPSPCRISTCQCWVERPSRTSRTCTSKAPSATAAQKFTVWAAGRPRRAGWSITAFSMIAAVAPPNGPAMFQ